LPPEIRKSQQPLILGERHTKKPKNLLGIGGGNFAIITAKIESSRIKQIDDNIQNQSHQKAIIRQKSPQKRKKCFGNIKKWLLVLIR